MKAIAWAVFEAEVQEATKPKKPTFYRMIPAKVLDQGFVPISQAQKKMAMEKLGAKPEEIRRLIHGS